VSIPPFGKTRVTLVVEQLLQQRLGEVEFELPLAPNEDVDDIKFDLSVLDTDGEPVLFELDLNVPGVYVTDENATQVLDPISLSIPDARQVGERREMALHFAKRLVVNFLCFSRIFHSIRYPKCFRASSSPARLRRAVIYTPTGAALSTTSGPQQSTVCAETSSF